jgi:hypothetical protein
MELNESQHNFLDNMKKQREIDAWITKLDYLNVRLIDHNLRNYKNRLRNQVTNEMSQSSIDTVGSRDFKFVK